MPDKKTAKWNAPKGCGRSLLFALALFFASFQCALAVRVTLEVVVVFWADDFLQTGQIGYPTSGNLLAQLVLYNQADYPTDGTGNHIPSFTGGGLYDYDGVGHPDFDADSQFDPYGDSYLPNTSPPGTAIVETMSIGELEFYEDSGIYGYLINFVLTFDTDDFDSFYVRLFDTEGFTDEAQEISWGIVGGVVVAPIADQNGINSMYWYSDGVLDQKDWFEVIPEPTTCSLLGLGAVALFCRRHKQRKS
jgi:hypothetical protein